MATLGILLLNNNMSYFMQGAIAILVAALYVGILFMFKEERTLLLNFKSVLKR
jgi:hypothetical protein